MELSAAACDNALPSSSLQGACPLMAEGIKHGCAKKLYIVWLMTTSCCRASRNSLFFSSLVYLHQGKAIPAVQGLQSSQYICLMEHCSVPAYLRVTTQLQTGAAWAGLGVCFTPPLSRGLPGGSLLPGSGSKGQQALLCRCPKLQGIAVR